MATGNRPPSKPSKAKIAPWDKKAQLKLAEEDLQNMKQRFEQLKAVTSDQESKLELLRKRDQELNKELEEKTSAIEKTHSNIQKFEERVEHLCNENVKLKKLNTETAEKLEVVKEAIGLRKQTIEILTKELDELEEGDKQSKIRHSDALKKLNELRSFLKQCQEDCAVMKGEIERKEDERKTLHNKILELKGNIRVFCRVRPSLPNEVSENDSMDHLIFTDECSLDVIKGPNKAKHSFSFDRTYPPATKQADVFEEIAELVQSVIDGYNVCVFAYGQTGSGKTYTMEGGIDVDEKGMIPRSIDHIFSILDGLNLLGWKYTVRTSFMEIYNEQIRDLLNGQPDQPCDIRNPTAAGGDMVITNLKVEVVKSASEVNGLLSIARSNRAVAATAQNDRSSRSHFIFKLHIVGENEQNGKITDATLSLVDLAGSERLADISDCARVAETKNINRSLSNLGNVILALARKSKHVPYRNSKLTHLLQPSLGGSSKTLMFVHLSPREDCLDETINSLRFAALANEFHRNIEKKIGMKK